MAAKFGDYYHMSFGPKACLSISDPSLIEGVLKTNVRVYHRAALEQSTLTSLLGYANILLAEYDKHIRHRRLVAPVFQHQNINSMISLMVERTSSFLARWTEVSSNKTQPLTLNIHEEMTNLTLDIVTRYVFGTEIIGDQHVHEIISRSITIAMKELEKRISEKHWHEPNKFDPSRFNERYSDIWLPFGAGPRSCIGQNFAMLQAKIMLAAIVRQFHFELVPGQKHVPDVAVTARPKYGIWMRISSR
ncbi:unnamed protein product [Rotaria sp. Silwood1]|nr:unnamed protein product [Rotaria sp. Silwood1]CAF3674486.1 unnamed protein product [Rotaria sp. Silwood1]CAF3701824.1 unnamed protein product [Rotaria sp. Silwood1]CAF4868399.1 unnamed protein product [Rotaria sp. Silwood1]